MKIEITPISIVLITIITVFLSCAVIYLFDSKIENFVLFIFIIVAIISSILLYFEQYLLINMTIAKKNIWLIEILVISASIFLGYFLFF